MQPARDIKHDLVHYKAGSGATQSGKHSSDKHERSARSRVMQDWLWNRWNGAHRGARDF